MKKVISFVLVVMLLASMVPTVFAANATANTTTLTTTVPDAEYTLNIPADQTIKYGATSIEIGNVTITGSKNFAVGKNIEVTPVYDAFKSETVSTVIPFELNYQGTKSNTQIRQPSGKAFVFKGLEEGTVTEMAEAPGSIDDNYIGKLIVMIKSSDWGKALAGDYSATITFTAAVVVAE